MATTLDPIERAERLAIVKAAAADVHAAETTLTATLHNLGVIDTEERDRQITEAYDRHHAVVARAAERLARS